MRTIAADLRYAVRVLRKRPWTAAVLLLTLATGIGANTAIFSFVNAILLKPLPYPDADRIVGMFEQRPSGARNAMTTLNYLDYARSDVFERVAATTVCCSSAMLGGGAGPPTPLADLKVSASYFDVLGATAALGRTFAAGEDQPGRNHVVVLSHRVWASRFGSDAALVGRTIQLDNEPYTVVGVMPANGPFDRSYVEAWVPIAFEGERMNRSTHWLLSMTGGAVGRLRPGVTIGRARAELGAIASRISTEYPASNKGWGITVDRYADLIVGPDLRRLLYLLLATVGIVLLIACVNVANVMLAWALARDREVAVRLALGAAPGRLIRQFLTEGLVVSIAGGCLGVAVGYGTMALLKSALARLPLNLGTLAILVPAEASIDIDWRVLSFSLVLLVACSIVFGLTPAVGTTRDVRSSLAHGQRSTAGYAHRRLQSALIVAEVALAFVLVVNAGLLVRSLANMRHADTGFDANDVLTAQISRSAHPFAGAPQLHAFMHEVLARVRALPGVVDAAFVDSMPMQGAPQGTFLQIAGRPIVDRAQRPVVDLKIVGPGYFHVLGLTPRRGRTLSDADSGTAPLAAVINDTMARTFFPNSDPVGQRLLMDAPGSGDVYTGEAASFEIVGVIGDERLTPFDDRRSHAVVYASNEQDARGFAGLIVRTSLDAARFGSALRTAVAAVNTQVAVTNVKTVDELESESMIPDRVRSALLGLFAAVALALSSVGVYGVISYSVVERTHELGIRAALGATRAHLIEPVVGRGMSLAAVGVAVGAGGTIAVARLLRSYLFGVGTLDLTTWTTAVLVLVGAAGLASFIPARDAARVDPMEALRVD